MVQGEKHHLLLSYHPLWDARLIPPKRIETPGKILFGMLLEGDTS